MGSSRPQSDHERRHENYRPCGDKRYVFDPERQISRLQGACERSEGVAMIARGVSRDNDRNAVIHRFHKGTSCFFHSIHRFCKGFRPSGCSAADSEGPGARRLGCVAAVGRSLSGRSVTAW